MTTDFGALLYDSLPGLYRDQDRSGELRRFLQLAALPLAEIEDSIAALQDDLFIASCRHELIGLIGDLVGVDVDPALPPLAQRAEVSDAIAFYRSKGLVDALRRYAEQLTRWRVALVDFSQQIVQTPFVTALDAVSRVRDGLVGEQPPGSGRFFFRVDLAPVMLHDGLTGQAITRQALAADGPAYAGVAERFTITLRSVDLFTGATRRTVVGADLSNPARPRTPSGSVLTVSATQVAVDPQLGRFLVGGPAVLAGGLRVSFQALDRLATAPTVLALHDPKRMARLGRSDAAAPVTLDLRAPRHPADRVGLAHVDNHGFFCTPARVISNRRPNAIGPDADKGYFTFDDRPLTPGDSAGVALQLLDGIDGAPLTRARLSRSERLYSGTARGFAIRVRTIDVSDPTRNPALRVRAADLRDFEHPRGPTTAENLGPADVLVDPQLGRFILNLRALNATADDVRVDYLLGQAQVSIDAAPLPVSPDAHELFAFAPDGADCVLVDAFDGTPIADALRLGRRVSAYDKTARGWSIGRAGTPIALRSVVMNLGGLTEQPPSGRLGVDPRRGRFRFPAGTPIKADQLTVRFAFADAGDTAQRFDILDARLPRGLPAGAVACVVDTRWRRANPSDLLAGTAG